jgi:hypothetical protein
MYTAKLTGSDGYVVIKMFTTIPDGLAWLQGAGLHEFGREAARGELVSTDGDVVWGKSNLVTPERIERIRSLQAHQLLARLGGPPPRQPDAGAIRKKEVEPIEQRKVKTGVRSGPWPKRKPTARKDWKEAESYFKRFRDRRVKISLPPVSLPKIEDDD